MADANVFLKPDALLASLEKKLKAAATAAEAAAIQAQIEARQLELTNQFGSVAFGSGGFITPNIAYSEASGPEYAKLLATQTATQKALAGKMALLPSAEEGMYSAAYYNAQGELNYFDPRLGMTSDPAAKGKPNYDPNAPSSKKVFYDASGNQLTPTQVAQTAQGQAFAKAGWDIGFGPGVLPAGTNIISTSTKNSGNVIGNLSTGTLTTNDIETKARRTAQQDFKAALGELGLADLADEVDRMIREDYTVSQIKIELPKTASYQTRFPGMEALRKAGRAISEATYIANEKGYLQTLRAYGLDTAVLGSRSELGKYISNEVSPREFEERVNLAATRVQENPDVIATFKSYYPEADQSGVITYLLNPKAGMDVIKKQVRVSEIGAAATKAGFIQQIGAEYAGTLVGAVGESTYAQISNEFQRARQLANSQRRLAQIENQAYSDLEAVSAVVGDEVNAALASERRAAREVARFGTRGGITGTSLGTTAQI